MPGEWGRRPGCARQTRPADLGYPRRADFVGEAPNSRRASVAPRRFRFALNDAMGEPGCHPSLIRRYERSRGLDHARAWLAPFPAAVCSGGDCVTLCADAPCLTVLVCNL